ncbi:ATP-binding cassette domain-containing protein [Candidatus Contubernalis alkaliaceticus]|uniref:ATP-binding cassette domain-containing protein n=1 Tax=Candidatus Contubernalis alkaliaceticus TaxID=338645 RepID=UPI001F4BFC68|nr:ABC transporter ATP-binding protein [Candidatus Contubernalis alkalaceticus]UNC92014.1 ABC transporter ATP-binding protein [Candidatus Contubernalis alkalaceticus]
MIRIDNVIFGYEKDNPILRSITLEENEPVITCLWGRNGAGKTTLMKLLAGHLRPDEGSIQIMGLAPYNNEQAVQHLCFMQEDHPFSTLWTVRNAFRFGQYYNPNWSQETAEQLLNIFKLDEKKTITKLSKGMKTALQFIIGLSSHANITIFDEPISGLDAGIRKKLYKALLESHENHPRLILLSTHHIEEVQPLCESLIVLHNGKLLMHKEIEGMRERGIWLTGEKNTLEKVVTSQKILEHIEAGNMVKAMIDAAYSKEWKETAQTYGLSIEKAKMQDYLLNITRDEEVSV